MNTPMMWDFYKKKFRRMRRRQPAKKRLQETKHIQSRIEERLEIPPETLVILERLVILEILEILVIFEILVILVILEILVEILETLAEILVTLAETLGRQLMILISVTIIPAIPSLAITTGNTTGVKHHTGEGNIPPWVSTTAVDKLNTVRYGATQAEDSRRHHLQWYGVIEEARKERLILTSNRRRNPENYKNLLISH